MAESWLTYHCRVREADVTRVEACLEEAGALAVSCHAAQGQPLVVDEVDGRTPLWPICELSGLFERDAEFGDLERRFSDAAVLPLRTWITTVDEQDWQEAWRQQFDVQCFGGRLWICPTWREPPVDAERVIRLDPGMAFGTGNHATTALCLEWLASSEDVTGLRVLDYGCGSGILAIAAAKLGATTVTAVDIDRDALAVCESNVRDNHVSGIEIAEPAELGNRQYDLVLANILLEPLIGLSTTFARLLVPGGRIALSGILNEQERELLAAYASGFSMQAPKRRGEWSLVAGSRKSLADH